MSNPRKQLPRRTDEDWYRLIMDCRKSGLSDAQFCRANGIPNSTFSTEVGGRIKNNLKERERQYPITKISFPETLQGTESYKKIQNITYKSKLDDFSSEWSERDEEKLVQLKKKSQLDIINTKIRQIDGKLRASASLILYFDLFEDYFSKRDVFLDSIVKYLESEIWYKTLDKVEEWARTSKSAITLVARGKTK